MKILKLKDKTELEFADVSTIDDLVIECESSAEADEIHGQLTAENLDGCEFDGQTYVVIPLAYRIDGGDDGKITAHFFTRKQTDIEVLRELIEEQEEVINYLLMQ